ncbi:MAG: VWA domain-containing protein [Polyangiaceae bacterium]|nr:VWA domain-containing protein [Polyangiaceae bacterium]
MKSSFRGGTLVGALALSAGLFHCGAGTDDTGGGAQGGTPSTGGNGGNGGAPSQGGAGGTGGENFTTSNGGNGGEGGTGGINECVSKTVEGEKVPLDMLIIQDRSGSMTTGTRWEAAVDAIKAFADDEGAAGIYAGLVYFPPVLGSECALASYQQLAVPIDILPDNAGEIKASLLNTTPGGGTPMRPALEGAIAGLTDYLTLNPNHEGVVVLVTDGDPGGCTNNTASDVEQVAADALAATPQIRTFVVGMDGANFSNLDNIAAAGGTNDAFDVGQGSADFLAALGDIRQAALSCEYVLPTPDPEEGTLDFATVGVNFIPGLNEDPTAIPKVDGEGSCGELSGGFYYDDPVNPTRVILCPASCDLIQTGTDNAKVDIVLGCILPPPE